jgi:hypothetical protein
MGCLKQQHSKPSSNVHEATLRILACWLGMWGLWKLPQKLHKSGPPARFRFFSQSLIWMTWISTPAMHT